MNPVMLVTLVNLAYMIRRHEMYAVTLVTVVTVFFLLENIENEC